jgi:hypothetical protein
MFDDLKKQRVINSSAQERTRLILFVGGCLLLGALVVALPLLSSDKDKEAQEAALPVEAGEPAPTPTAPVVEGKALWPLVTTEVTGPDGAPVRVERTASWADDAIQYMRSRVRGAPLTHVATRVDPSGLAALDPRESLGKVFEVRGYVTARTEQVWQTEQRRLWTFVISTDDDETGARALAVVPGLASDPDSGAPSFAYRLGPKERVAPGHFVIVRGYYLQRRTGSVGDISLSEPTPVLYATTWRHPNDPSEMKPAPASLQDIRWQDVKDRFLADTKKLEVTAVRQTIQWARQQGPKRLRQMLDDGTLPSTEWDQDVFNGAWYDEVSLRTDEPRPWTDSARGQVFRTSGLVASVSHEGWDTVRPNEFGVDHFETIDLFSDHYSNSVMRTISPFPLSAFGGIKGEKNEHVWIYGVFVKNHSYEKRQAALTDGTKHQIITVPFFVVLDVRPRVYDAAGSGFQTAMKVVAGVMVLLGLLFYFVFIRGERKEAARMEEHRRRLRQRMRARAEAAANGELPTDATDAPDGD